MGFGMKKIAKIPLLLELALPSREVATAGAVGATAPAGFGRGSGNSDVIDSYDVIVTS